jgi:cobalt-zinc-cadmium efflux system outer membrane protein
LRASLLFWVVSAPARAAAPPQACGGDGVPPRLSLPEAESLFLTCGLDVLIAQSDAQGAEGDLQAAGAHPNPGLDASALYTPQLKRDLIYPSIGASAPGSLWGLNLGVTDNGALEDQLSGKRSLRMEAASKALAAARINVDDVRRVGLGELRQAYVAAVMAGLDVVAARESFETYDKQLQLNQKRYDEGAIGGLDLARAKQAQLEALQTIDQVESGRKQALAALLFLLGVRGATPPAVTLTGGIGYAVLGALREASLPWLHGQALAHRTDARIAQANLEQAQVVVRQAKRARIPNVSMSLGYTEQCGSASCTSQPAFNAGLQANLPVFYQQQGEIRRAESNAQAAQHSLARVQAQVLEEVSQAFAAYTAAKSQVERMEALLLEQAKVSRDLAQHMYQRGAASFIDFMDAQRAYVSSRLEYHRDLASYWNAVYRLEQVTAVALR